MKARVDVLSDPLHGKFQLGEALGEKNKVWRRIKNGLPKRHRLFFRFSSQKKEIIFVWLNDEGTLRKDGDSHDVYTVFRKMVDDGTVPVEYKDLIKRSKIHY